MTLARILSPGSFFSERRRRFTRRYFGAAGSSAGSVAALPTGGQRTGGSTITCQPPILSLVTGVGANRIVQIAEQHGQDTDWFAFPDGLTAWQRKHYVHCYLGHAPLLPAANPTATAYTGVELRMMNAVLPWPVPPISIGGADVALHLRARLDTGAWELLQDDGVDSQLTVLTGVTAYDITGVINSRAEIYYDPAGSIIAAINGIVGAEVAVLGNWATSNMSHFGSGVFVTSGTNAAGNQGQCFYDLLAETEMGP